jgi:hypothetical protein
VSLLDQSTPPTLPEHLILSTAAHVEVLRIRIVESERVTASLESSAFQLREYKAFEANEEYTELGVPPDEETVYILLGDPAVYAIFPVEEVDAQAIAVAPLPVQIFLKLLPMGFPLELTETSIVKIVSGVEL